MATQYAFGKIVTSGLVLSLNAADRNSYPGSGTTWTDMSGNGNDGTLTNGPTFSSANGGSIVFDGVDDYTTGSLSSPTVGCISMWINSNTIVDASSSFKSLILLRYTGVTDSEFNISLGSATSLLTNEYITIANVTNSQRTGITDGGSLLANTWYNIVFNSESGKYQIYINSVFKTSSVYLGGVSTITDGNMIVIGGLVRNSVVSGPFNGSISNVLLYNRGLTISEILQNYNAQKSRFGL